MRSATLFNISLLEEAKTVKMVKMDKNGATKNF